MYEWEEEEKKILDHMQDCTESCHHLQLAGSKSFSPRTRSRQWQPRGCSRGPVAIWQGAAAGIAHSAPELPMEHPSTCLPKLYLETAFLCY